MAVSRASWPQNVLRRYSTTIYACHFCGATRITDVWFAMHLVRDHDVRDPVVLRFVGLDSDVVSPDRLQQALDRDKGTPALS